MKINVLILFIFSLAILSITGCYYDKESELYPNKTGCDSTNVTYSGKIKQLVADRCASPGCHVAGAQAPDLSNYTLVAANIARVKVRAIDLKTMPSGSKLTECEIGLLTKWINAGNPNN